MTKRCVVCDTKFEPSHGNIKTCSDPCKVEHRKKYNQRYFHRYFLKNRDAELERRREYYCDKVRKLKVRTCMVCGARFETSNCATACSMPCRVERNRRRVERNYKAIREQRQRSGAYKKPGGQPGNRNAVKTGRWTKEGRAAHVASYDQQAAE